MLCGAKVASTTVMLIVISILFLIFSIPIDIYFLGYAYGTFRDETAEEGAIRWLFYALVTLAYYTNNNYYYYVFVAAIIIIIIRDICLGFSLILTVFSLALFFIHVRLLRYSACSPNQPSRILSSLFYGLAYYTNNSINFFMYFASGRKFRDAFLNTFFCIQPKKPGTPSTSGTAVTGVQNTMSMTAMTQVQNN